MLSLKKQKRSTKCWLSSKKRSTKCWLSNENDPRNAGLVCKNDPRNAGFCKYGHKVVSSHKILSNVLATSRKQIRCLEVWHSRHHRGSFPEHPLLFKTIHEMLDFIINRSTKCWVPGSCSHLQRSCNSWCLEWLQAVRPPPVVLEFGAASNGTCLPSERCLGRDLGDFAAIEFLTGKR